MSSERLVVGCVARSIAVHEVVRAPYALSVEFWKLVDGARSLKTAAHSFSSGVEKLSAGVCLVVLDVEKAPIQSCSLATAVMSGTKAFASLATGA